ncbi:MAG: hypothetical protein B6U78_00065 [Candidatus Aenigmarchaeota archaeon ex4484_224]|nr:MAG: hypothetical protein B6U78_00065 [Candidatus Aenigmarchaeota archaeon ex4484_224]
MKPLISLRNVWKIYGKGTKVYALRSVNFKVYPNDFIAVLGPSGSGKSTLLHIMGTLDIPTKGDVFIDGINISKLSEKELAEIRREKIGFVFQFFYLFPTLTALENVMLPMTFLKIPKSEKRKRALELLKLVGLEKRANHLPNQLSGGERQRVAIARALANNPKIVLADEPTGNLDSKSGKKILELLKKLNKERKVTIVLVTHNLEMAKFAKKKVFIKDGRILEGRKR